MWRFIGIGSYAGCGLVKSIFIVALAFVNGAPLSERGLCPLRFGVTSLAYIVAFF
jgi:hypothetical protein